MSNCLNQFIFSHRSLVKVLTLVFPIFVMSVALSYNECSHQLAGISLPSATLESGIIAETLRNVSGSVFRSFRRFSRMTTERLVLKYGGLDTTILSLTQIGYSPKIAQKLVNVRPDLVDQIMKAQKFGLGKLIRPVTVYRVLRLKTLADFKENYFSPSFPDQTFVGTSIDSCVWFAHGTFDSNVTMLIELQIPIVILRNPIMGLSGKYIGYSDVPDISPFLSRTGEIVWTNRNNLEYNVSWHSDDSIKKEH